MWRVFAGTATIGLVVWALSIATPPGADDTLSSDLSGYSACIGDFLNDVSLFEDCLNEHAGKKCMFDSNMMSTWHDAAICIVTISNTENITSNAVVIQRSHHVCYNFVNTVGECLGRAVQVQDLTTCFRKEVLARFGYVLESCRNSTGYTGDDEGDEDQAWQALQD